MCCLSLSELVYNTVLATVYIYLIAMTEHGAENSFQEREHVFIGFKQAPHGLQFHHLCIRTLSNWEKKNKNTKKNLSAPEIDKWFYPHLTSVLLKRVQLAGLCACLRFWVFLTYCFGSPPRWMGRSGSCRCFRPSSKSRRSSSLPHEASASQSPTALDTKSCRWTPLRSQTEQMFRNLWCLLNVEILLHTRLKWSVYFQNKRTNCETELEHVDSSFLFEEVHETKEEILLFSDFLQLKLQHLMDEKQTVYEYISLNSSLLLWRRCMAAPPLS